jgi:TonB family protein
MRTLRLAIFILVIELHVLAIVSINLDIQAVSLKEEEPVRVMKLTDLTEYIPPSPDPLPPAPPVSVMPAAPPVPPLVLEEPGPQEEPSIPPEEPPPPPEEPAPQEKTPPPPEEPAPQEEPPPPREEPVPQEQRPPPREEPGPQEKLPPPREEPAPQEEPPPPPVVSPKETPREEAPPDVVVDDIAEVMIETDAEPVGQIIVEPEVQTPVDTTAAVSRETDLLPENPPAVEKGDSANPPAQFSAPPEDEYLPAHRISVLPQFPRDEILRALIYPPAARRSGIEGRVVLELFIDRTGTIRRIDIVQEEPAGRGFGEAARTAFQNILCKPAKANGQDVSARVRYPVSFRLH